MITATELDELRRLCCDQPSLRLADLAMLLIRSYMDALRREEALRGELESARAEAARGFEAQATLRIVTAYRDALQRECERLRAALEAIITAADSPQAEGGEMWFAEAVSAPIEAARAALEARDA